MKFTRQAFRRLGARLPSADKRRLVGCRLVVGLLACLTPAAAGAQVDYIDPAGGFTQVVAAAHEGVKTVFVSGQVGRGDTLREHVESAFAGVVRRLEQAGAGPEDVVKIRIFVKDFEPEQYPVVAQARAAVFPEGHWPASTMVGVRVLFAEALRVEIEALAVVAEPGADLKIERFNPANGFSGAVAVTAHGMKTVYVAGQVGGGDTLAAQTAEVWGRVERQLETAGASLADLVKATTYIVDFDPGTDLAAYRAGREQALSLADMPASTLLGVPALAAEQFRVEIDGVAVVGADGGPVERAFIDPAAGFTQVVTARASGPAVVRVSGQVGQPGASLDRQADQVYANLRRRLEAAGAGPDDLLKVVIYMPDYAPGDFAVVDEARRAHGFRDETAPAATLLGIQSLFADGALLEIEGTAVAAPGDRLPDDVNPESRSRLPLIDREELDPARRAAWDAAAGGPAGAPTGAEALRLHGSGASLRFEAPIGRRLTELTVLTTAREYDQPYEWALHELEALAVGLDDGVIDAVRHRRPLTGLSDREAVVIEVGRELFGTRRLGADTYARALARLGKTNLVDVIDVMGRYASTAATLTAFNQQMPAGWRQSLPLPFTHPNDIHPDSRSRLPLRSPASRTAVAELYGRMLSPSGIGPGVIRSYGAGQATLEARVGRRSMLLAILVTARMHDSQYDWTMHEPEALQAGVEPSLIDIVRHDRPLTGIGENDAALIAFGRELFGDHNVGAETYARAERAFGVQDLVDLVGLMGAHAADAAVLAAFDQHLPEGVEPRLPLDPESAR